MKFVVLFVVLMSSSVFAQQRDISLSSQIGVSDAESPVFVGAFDVYLSPRVSVRPGVMWANDLNQRRAVLLWDVIYNWDGGVWHPFITAGSSMHLMRTRPLSEHDELNFGASMGVGADVFVRTNSAVIVEATYFAVEKGRLTESPSAYTFRVGLKQFF